MAAYPKSVAYTRLFKLIASSDHLSKLTGASPTVNISKAGAAFGAAAGTVTEVANGWYKVALTTADTGTAGDLAFYITAASADDTDFVDQVLDPTVANYGVNVVQINAVSTSPVTTVKAIQGLTTADTIATYTGNTVQTGDAYARLGAPAGASMSADVAAVKTDTAAVKVQTDKLTFTVANQIDANVIDWKSATAPAMTGDAFARLGAPAGASVSADVAAVKSDTASIKTATNTGVAPGAASGLAIVGSNMGTVSSVTGAVASVTGAVGSVGAAVTITSSVKKNQALAKFQFLMTDSTTNAPKTGLTVSVTRSIDGGAYAAGTLANVAEVGSGMYTVDFGAGDLNGTVVVLQTTAVGANTMFERVITQP